MILSPRFSGKKKTNQIMSIRKGNSVFKKCILAGSEK